YYACSARREDKGSCPNDTANVRAEGAEEAVWRLVRGLVTDPKRLRVGLDAHVEQERAKAGGDSGAERKGWAAQLTDADRKRSKYQEMFAADAMSMDELKSKLAELGRQRTEAETALVEIAGRDEKLKELERDREATLRAYGEAAPEALDALDGEGRNSLYRALSLAVTAHPGRELMVSGPLVVAEGPLEDVAEAGARQRAGVPDRASGGSSARSGFSGSGVTS
ncbi:MAG: hypothetical protein M3Q60_16110, partial [Actinomycetota bacterium]|nr:hypothetical protein [Actinomycetota bacterium]